MTITIKGKDYKLKNTIRAIFIFEQISGKAFEITNVTDNTLYFYSLILANNPDTTLEFDELCDALDEDMSIMTQLNTLLAQAQKRNSIFNESDEADGEKKS